MVSSPTTSRSLERPTPIRLALVGLGNIARTHAVALRAIPVTTSSLLRPSIEVAVTSRGEAARVDAAACGIDRIASLDEAISDERIDVFDVTSRTDQHAAQAEQILRADRSIYVEKPVGSTPRESGLVSAQALQAKAVHHVGLVMRYHPAVVETVALLRSGAIGSVRHARIGILRGGYLDPAGPMTWKLRRDQGGGVALDLGVHALDLVRLLVGAPVLRKAAARTIITDRLGPDGARQSVTVEDWAWAELEVEDTHVTVEVSRVAYGAETSFIQLYGSEGSVVIDLLRDTTPTFRRFDGNESHFRTHAHASDLVRSVRALAPTPRLTLGWFTDVHATSLHHFLLRAIGADPVPDYAPTIADAVSGESMVWEILEAASVSPSGAAHHD